MLSILARTEAVETGSGAKNRQGELHLTTEQQAATRAMKKDSGM